MRKNKLVTLTTLILVIFIIAICSVMAEQSVPPEMDCSKLWYPGGWTCAGGSCNGPGRPDPATTCVIDCSDGPAIICDDVH